MRQTSLDAYAEITEDGTKRSQQERVYLVIKNNPQGIVKWAKAPYMKLKGYPPMPPQNLPDEQLKAVADFLLTPKALNE